VPFRKTTAGTFQMLGGGLPSSTSGQSSLSSFKSASNLQNYQVPNYRSTALNAIKTNERSFGDRLKFWKRTPKDGQGIGLTKDEEAEILMQE
jgi:hypothetical protein